MESFWWRWYLLFLMELSVSLSVTHTWKTLSMIQIKEGDFLNFDASRQVAQCVGRVIQSKADYGLMIFADKRYSRHDKRSKLPGWILSHLRDAHSKLSTDMAIHITREFLRKLAQLYDKAGTSGRKTLLTQENLEKMAETGVQDMVY